MCEYVFVCAGMYMCLMHAYTCVCTRHELCEMKRVTWECAELCVWGNVYTGMWVHEHLWELCILDCVRAWAYMQWAHITLVLWRFTWGCLWYAKVTLWSQVCPWHLRRLFIPWSQVLVRQNFCPLILLLVFLGMGREKTGSPWERAPWTSLAIMLSRGTIWII